MDKNNSIRSLVVAVSCSLFNVASAAPVDGPLSLSKTPLFTTTANKPNILVVMDNSNSMDEDATGAAAGSANPTSKSEIARGVIRNQLIPDYMGRINLGLMAYAQKDIIPRHLHNSPYDVSFNPANYDPLYAGDRDSSTKRYRTPNPTSPGNYLYFNINLPFYAGGNYGNAFCYSPTADFDNGSENPDTGPWDTYRCFKKKVGTSDGIPTWGNGGSEYWRGYRDFWFTSSFHPTDSDFAQNILDFGKVIAWSYVSPTWLSNTNPGGGYVHVPVAPLDATQEVSLDKKLATSQFVYNQPTHSDYPLQNAGLTPIEGTLLSAKTHLQNAGLPESCGKDYVALLTDGLPSVDKDGQLYADSADAMTKTALAAAELHDAGIDTYVIGFALPYGVDPNALDILSDAGGTIKSYSATDTASLSSAFSSIFGDILSRVGSAAAAATSSTSLKTDTRTFLALFHSGNWSGYLLSKGISLDGTLNAAAWEAGAELSAKTPASRKIITYSRDSKDGIAFNWSDIDGQSDKTQRDFLNKNAQGVVDNRGADRVAFLRGNDHVTGMRQRGFILGDIVNSTPFFVSPPGAGYSGSSYLSFMNSNKARESIVYVGANDGMLHGFAADSGEELIAYVPGPVYKGLSDLTHANYGTNISPVVQHRYSVDGSPLVADIEMTEGGVNWKTVLIGGLNSGGQGYYGLDITDPTQFSESNADDLVLWEFTDEDDADLGYTYTQPTLNVSTNQSAQIAKMANGKWAVIVGNGYNNTEADGHASMTGHAYLFIIYIERGMDGSWSESDYVKIDTAVGTTSIPNGLSTPQPVDVDGDGDMDYVYAGDVYGNLWRFTVESSDDSTWDDSTNRSIIARTVDADGNAQPITTVPQVTPGLVADSFIVTVGTGKYLETNDISDSMVQTFYGFIDSNPQEQVPAGSRQTLTRNDLGEQTVIAVVTKNDHTYRVVSSNSITSEGWFMDLPESGERVANNPVLRDGRVVFPTLIPDTADCAAGGTSWLMELDIFTGGSLSESPFNTDDQPAIDSNDRVDMPNGELAYAAGLKSNMGIITTPAVIDASQKTEFKILTGSEGKADTVLESKALRSGRLSWQEIR